MSSCSTPATAAGSLRATSGRSPCRSTSPSSSSAPIRTSWNSARPTAERRHAARQRSTLDPLPCKLQEAGEAAEYLLEPLKPGAALHVDGYEDLHGAPPAVVPRPGSIAIGRLRPRIWPGGKGDSACRVRGGLAHRHRPAPTPSTYS